MSAPLRDAPHCPHCGAALPESDAAEPTAPPFCPACGRRVEGWRTGFRASIGGAHASASDSGDDQATRAVAPSPQLLRAAIAAEAAKQPEPTERVAPVKRSSSPVALLGMIGGAAAFAVSALLVLGRPHRPPIVRPAPTIVPAEVPKVEPPPPLVAPPVVATAHVLAAEPPPAKPTDVKYEPSKPLPSTKEPSKAPPKVASGALPHKNARTDSKTSNETAVVLAGQPSGTGAPMVPPPTQPGPPPLVSNEPERPAQTAEVRKDEGAAQLDASNVRYVVQSHLAQVQACYGRAFKESAPGGRVDIGFVIGSNGRASKVRTEQNQTRSSMLSNCLEHLIADWQFVRPASGELELIYPFVFSPGT